MADTTDVSFHEIADQAVTSATEILAIAETSDTEADTVKAGLRHKVIALSHIVDDMKRSIGVPVAATDTLPIPISKSDLIKLDEAMRDIRRLHSTLTLFSASVIDDTDKVDEAIIADVINILRDIVSGIWDSVDVAILSIRKKLVDNGQLEAL